MIKRPFRGRCRATNGQLRSPDIGPPAQSLHAEELMTHQKAKDALDTIGTVLTKDEGRDAVHLAVVCCRAFHLLAAGEDVCLVENTGRAEKIPVVRRAVAKGDVVLGVVDPFLKVGTVEQNDLIWVFLTPRTITSLTHRWTHPAFPEEPK